jgi:predicted transcriptional regulator
METTITIRLSEDLKKSLQKLADNDRRKLSDFIRLRLEEIANSKKKKS